MNSPATPQAITIAAHFVAQAERKLEAAQGAHRQKADHADLIRERIREADDRRADIRTKLGAGELSDREAGALLASIADDVHDLEKLLASANADVTTAQGAVNAAQDALSVVRADLDKAVLAERFALLQTHAADIERVFINALADLGELSRRLGNPAAMSRAHRLASELRAIVTYDTIPARRG